MFYVGAISKTATAPIESVRMQIMTGAKVCELEFLTSRYKGIMLSISRIASECSQSCRALSGRLWAKHTIAVVSWHFSAATKQVGR